MSLDESIVVLTTRERNWWWSMQEVVPALENVWTRIDRTTPETIRTYCVPLPPEVEHSLQTSAVQPKLIVITSVTAETERIALLLRVQLERSAPMVIYLCGDSTEGFHSFGPLADTLTTHDTLVVSSEADAAATRCCFPNARVVTAPFPLVDQFPVNRGDRETRVATASLTYVGRVSEQKNLHTLLVALWFVRTHSGRGSEITLDVYGGEDHLGSPNMGLVHPNYGAYLHGLVDVLGLEDLVTWHGFRSRDWLFDNVHLEPHVLVSPTLHSDENFGTSVLASLVNGHQVVATVWGGHLDFQQWFPRQLTMVPVHRSSMGPVVDPVLLANAILGAVDRRSTFEVPEADLERARTAFSESESALRMLDLLGPPDGRPMPLDKSPILQRIDERRAKFGGTRKIYDSYGDPLVQSFFEAYGMREPLVYRWRSRYALPPWVSLSADVVTVDDPHRGRQSLDIGQRGAPFVDVAICPSMESRRLPQRVVRDLVTMGYAFELPPRDLGG